MSWRRPVPVIGDQTSAGERGVDPAGWAFEPETIESLYRVLHDRRDIRRFRADEIDDGLLRRVLGAAHSAPSVRHSQPWRFVLVRDVATRDRAAWLADRERLAQAAQMEPAAAAHLLDLKLEGIREALMGIVVCCDRRAAAAGVLGRATFPDTDLWSCACAIQNLWLAARAEGLGVGWVTLFRPEDLAALVGLPDGVVPLGWLCVGWPDERPPDPGLERAAWSQRLELEAVLVQERWPDLDVPLPPTVPAARARTGDHGRRPGRCRRGAEPARLTRRARPRGRPGGRARLGRPAPRAIDPHRNVLLLRAGLAGALDHLAMRDGISRLRR